MWKNREVPVFDGKVLMDDGKVEWTEEPIENPFEKRCDELEND